ncbi:hypothetical protein J0A67_20015 [Algoriphagus aestuariicola]|uniref:IPT/TIG domain-containing protein n=1 Tax=Algoriphagus aestuariicola TaxID=1852016 RepID=A0ABS3BVA4_9BACT|nr:hypothetical protein [Algoriphagus aestuariicola]MBN7803171.1 hypothetical protein [Algoriphagus aestuariicola]
MKRISWILLIAVFALMSCEQEEFISGRAHHFVLSMGIADLDETGVTVEFEVRKTGTAPIEEYGVEYTLSENLAYGRDAQYDKVSESGAPGSALASIRISYDLVAGREYTARPYVKSGGTIVYGENLVFSSQGGPAPIITEVSPAEFYRNSQLTLKGDYFNSKLEHNSLEIVNGGENYEVSIDSVSRTEIKMRIKLIRPIINADSQSLSLKLTSGGKSVLFPVEITSIVPKITQMGPSSVYVGDKVMLEFNYPPYQTDYGIWLNYTPPNGYPLWFQNQVSPLAAEFLVPDTPAGVYVPSFVNTWFPQQLTDRKLEILPTWEKFQVGVDVPKRNEQLITAVGDKLLMIGYDDTDNMAFRRLDLGATRPVALSAPPTENPYRSSPVLSAQGDRYLYYGLGFRYLTDKTEPVHDFFRLDTHTGQWERLADFPFDYTSVINSFFFKGKLYVILWNYLNFRVYDPATNQWSMSSVEVPNELRSSASVVPVQDHIYFLTSQNPLQVSRYSIGGQIELFGTSDQWINHGGSLILWDGNLLFMNNGMPLLRMDMGTREFRLVQRVGGHFNSSFIPWPTSQGLLMALRIDGNSGIQEDVIYRLIQDF